MGQDLRELIRRVESYEPFPLTALEAIRAVRRHLADFELSAIATARERGATWATIAEALGLSRQAAQMKFMKQRNREAQS